LGMKNIDFNFVADIYDAYVNVDFDVDFFNRYTKEVNGKCLELMCGTGRVSVPLLNNGIALTCVDYSEEMLKVLERKIVGVDNKPRIVCQDVCELNLDEIYKLIFIPFNSFSEITIEKKQEIALSRISKHLADDGIFICTLYNPSYRVKTADGQFRVLGRFFLEPDKTLVVSYYNQYDAKTKTINGMQFYEIYDANNIMIDKRFLDINFSLIAREAFEIMALNNGFRVKEVFGDYSFSPYTESSMFMNLVLTKRV
jgi:SAM-dependent methyltransferase